MTERAGYMNQTFVDAHFSLGKRVGIASLLELCALGVYLRPALRGRPLTETPEARVAVVAREMLASHNYIVPTLGGKPRLIKPPVPFWLTAALVRALRPSETPRCSVESPRA